MCAIVAASGCSGSDGSPGREVELSKHKPKDGGSPYPMKDAAVYGDDAGFDDAGCAPEACKLDPCEGGIAIPADQHYAAPGLCVRAVATQQGRLRQITFAPNGDLFGVTVDGDIRRYRDLNCDGAFDSSEPERVVWASTGGNGNNVHLDLQGGYAYAGVPNGVKRWRYVPGADQGMDEQWVVQGHPSTGNHTYATTHVFDGYLYVQSGSEGNVSDPASPAYDTNRSVIKRFPLASFDPSDPWQWTEGEVFAVGLRNTVGFTQHGSGAIYGVVNGIDDLYYEGKDIHEGNPADTVMRIVQGGQYGYPYCFNALDVETADGRQVAVGTPLHTELAPDSGFTNPHDDAWCRQNALMPAAVLDAHSAPLDITFFERKTGKLPARWLGGAFVSLHGSWNDAVSTGHKIVWLPFDEQGRAVKDACIDENGEVDFQYEVVFGGGSSQSGDGGHNGEAEDGEWGWSAEGTGEALVRPVGVALSPDGALYVSSDNGPVFGVSEGPGMGDGAIYRIEQQP